jgi:cell division protease FtsH
VLDDMVLKLLDKETLTKADLTDIFASVDKRPHRVISAARRAPTDRQPVLTAAELALLGPNDVADLANGNGNGTGRSKANGSKDNGSKSTAAGRKTAARPRTSKATTAQRTSQPRASKRTEGRGEAPGTPETST